MRTIFLFMNVSLDGYFEAPGHDISGFRGDMEAFSPGQATEVDTILLGRRTYEMMKSFWPTQQAERNMPEVAKFMSEKLKVVVSHTPFEPGWKNVRVISADVSEEIKRLKEQPGEAIIIFGSNNLCVSLLQEDLIDELQIMLNPVLFGAGTSLFTGLSKRVVLNLTDTRRFKSGAMLLTYKPG
jgi:dihydrofolate reductase